MENNENDSSLNGKPQDPLIEKEVENTPKESQKTSESSDELPPVEVLQEELKVYKSFKERPYTGDVNCPVPSEI